jgi:hypothetical protein
MYDCELCSSSCCCLPLPVPAFFLAAQNNISDLPCHFPYLTTLSCLTRSTMDSKTSFLLTGRQSFEMAASGEKSRRIPACRCQGGNKLSYSLRFYQVGSLSFVILRKRINPWTYQKLKVPARTRLSTRTGLPALIHKERWNLAPCPI